MKGDHEVFYVNGQQHVNEVIAEGETKDGVPFVINRQVQGELEEHIWVGVNAELFSKLPNDQRRRLAAKSRAVRSLLDAGRFDEVVDYFRK